MALIRAPAAEEIGTRSFTSDGARRAVGERERERGHGGKRQTHTAHRELTPSSRHFNIVSQFIFEWRLFKSYMETCKSIFLPLEVEKESPGEKGKDGSWPTESHCVCIFILLL